MKFYDTILYKKGGRWMEYVIKGLSFLMIPIIVNGVISCFKKPEKGKKGQVYLSKFILISGTIAATVFLVPTFITVFKKESIWTSVLLFIFSLLGAILIIAYFNCRITYDESDFTAKSFFGIKRKYTYEQITAIRENMHEDDIYIGKHKVRIDEYATGGKDFIQFVKKQYRILHHEEYIPQQRTSKWDIFNGNIKDVTGFMVVYILISVLAVGFLICVVVYGYGMPSNEGNTIRQQVCFDSCIQQEDSLFMFSTENQVYQVPLDSGVNIEKMKAVCDGKTTVTTYSKESTSEDKAPYFSVKAIYADGGYIFSFEDSIRIHQKESLSLIVIVGIMNLLWFAYIAMSVIIGRNPQKFSKKIVRLFFKDGYVND